jgi:hypothetical protein
MEKNRGAVQYNRMSDVQSTIVFILGLMLWVALTGPFQNVQILLWATLPILFGLLGYFTIGDALWR